MAPEAAVVAQREQSFLEVAGKTLALVTLLLPANGVLIRFVAFLPAKEISSPLQIALAAPLTELAAAGALGLLPAIGYVFLYWFARRSAPSIRAIYEARIKNKQILVRLDALDRRLAKL
jgi:hypothetical protein